VTDRRVEGVVEEALPRGLYRIRTDDGRAVTATLGAEARRVTVRVMPGDRVMVSLSPYDPTRGRIESKRKP